mgnify:CR=1 FL=1
MKTIQYKVYDKEGKLRKLIDKNKEKQLNDDEWLNGVTCFVINEKGEALIEKRVNKGLTPGKLDLCSGHVDGEETQTQAMGIKRRTRNTIRRSSKCCKDNS